MSRSKKSRILQFIEKRIGKNLSSKQRRKENLFLTRQWDKNRISFIVRNGKVLFQNEFNELSYVNVKHLLDEMTDDKTEELTTGEIKVTATSIENEESEESDADTTERLNFTKHKSDKML